MMGIRAVARLFFGTVLVAGSAGAQNLLVNGSFEQPVFTDPVSNPGSLPGWTSSPSPFEVWNQFQGPGADGNQYLELDVATCTTISQTIPTSSDRFYRVSLAFAARTGVQDNRIEVLWNGAVIGTASADGSAVGGNVQWTRHSYAAQPGGVGSSTLSIRNVDVCDGLGSLLDDVSVVEAAPPASIPTLGGFGIALMMGMFALSALGLIRRNRM